MGRTAIPPRVRKGCGYERYVQVLHVGLQQVHQECRRHATRGTDGTQHVALPPHYTYERATTNNVWRKKYPTPLSLYRQQRTRDTHTAVYKGKDGRLNDWEKYQHTLTFK